MIRFLSAFCATVALVPCAVKAQQAEGRPPAEVAIGLLAHGVPKPFRGPPPPGTFYANEAEGGTVDLHLVLRSPPLRGALKPRLTAKLYLNTGGRTSLASVGAEWRQYAFRRRVYGQVGIGLALHDGYLQTPDPFAPGIGRAEAERRYAIYSTRTDFGSRVLFNPSFSIGVQLNRRLAAEATYEHFSHNGWFGRTNPGLETMGLRIVYKLRR
ncbi:MAG: acyloxyacyl hydrolase [Sphingomonas sp.]|uniref:acyloxyacyl hydrolase n=1 Tax=Sphingomonas sp. TaxID=28214 RepID=UPI0025E600DE|nr:acyloxyacyl hydrolase [Sphingomonas sp.]MBX9881399.1 acyloxyacyl hydrolase [Sphingomonas sp.]